jgi:hypothetical protein
MLVFLYYADHENLFLNASDDGGRRPAFAANARIPCGFFECTFLDSVRLRESILKYKEYWQPVPGTRHAWGDHTNSVWHFPNARFLILAITRTFFECKL